MSLQFRKRFTDDFDRIKVHLDKDKRRTTTKIQKTTIDWLLKNYDFNRSYLVTLHLNDTLGFKKEVKDLVFNEISQINKRFIRRLHNKVFSKNSKNRLEVFTVIENLKNKIDRNHIHLIISTEKHMTREMMIVEIVRSFERTKKLKDIHIKRVENDVSNLVSYLTKQLRVMTLDDDTIDWKNCYLNKNNYLQITH